MKRKLFLTVMMMTVSILAFTQGNSGLGFNYQAVVRGADGFVLPSKSIELRFSLLPGQQATEPSWMETHNVTTDALGTIGVTVGKGAKAGGVAATFADVNFAAVHYWMKVEIKENGNYRELSYTALASVPYAEAATNAASSPIGSIMPFAGDASKVPDGWLLCDGSAVSRSEYAALYEIIGTAWGFGNNASTFNLPDMRGMFLRGISGNSEKDEDAEKRAPLQEGGNSGNNVGSYQEDAIKNITGTMGYFLSSGWTGGNSIGDGCFSTTIAGSTAGTGDGGHYPTIYKTDIDASRVVSVGSDIRPQNVYVNYIIKY